MQRNQWLRIQPLLRFDVSKAPPSVDSDSLASSNNGHNTNTILVNTILQHTTRPGQPNIEPNMNGSHPSPCRHQQPTRFFSSPVRGCVNISPSHAAPASFLGKPCAPSLAVKALGGDMLEGNENRETPIEWRARVGTDETLLQSEENKTTERRQGGACETDEWAGEQCTRVITQAASIA